uniref:uncharacterized protein LOC120333732 n=1 Tax=Styela clava TaxID=7725 RepID=UPI00193956A5|nr:uncharacterized protein LOC120333732 [Styela clava]
MEVNLNCCIASCSFKGDNLKEILKHLKTHTKFGSVIICPYINCLKDYSNYRSLCSHIYRCHKSIHYPICGATSSSIDTEAETNFSDVEPVAISENPSEIFYKQSALFYASLQYRHLVPGITIDKIIHQKSLLIIKQSEIVLDVIKNISTSGGVPESVIEELQSSVSNALMSNPISDGTLRTKYSPEQFYKRQFPFVEPISFNIGRSTNREYLEPATYEYVPILQSIRALFKFSSIRQQFLNPPCNDGHQVDVKDGETIMNNTFFQCNNSLPRLQIILYQDAFEIVNPLGSAKRKHKILACYFSLGNIYPYCRSKINSIQLVLLVKEKYLESSSVEDIFKPLLNDLKILETDGVDLGFIHKGRV